MAYILSIEAEEDIIAIFLSGVEHFGMTQAEEYHGDLKNTFDLLALNPKAARIREELTPSIRVHPHGSHIILYTINEKNDVFIIRVRHAHEDWIHH